MTATREEYEAAFALECQSNYPAIDDFVDIFGHEQEIDGRWFRDAARVLACPVKINPPCWQHGRVLYSSLREFCSSWKSGSPLNVLDIGTAKGFSAIVMARALEDAGQPGDITSVDVLDPQARVRRNTVAEVGGLKTLYEIVAPWPESRRVKFVCAKAENWLMMHRERVHYAFVDGKHSYEAVKKELAYLSQAQQTGDVIVCDDLQVPGVEKAIGELRGYGKQPVRALPNRGYMIMEKL